ncbi:hypothetical protein AI2602V1_0700 [Citrobacter freundii]|uniref:hypothetical protein n=1 Tax=Citrobacter TaxID=544 RepID=UPI001DCDED53|nr:MULTISPECIES: hypothetical protein [Citrobacter]EHW4288298.1 hypothetical protein [Salmonella enterica subsp. enterica serovar Lagos]MDM3095370.1 hypothetical protein [Citrobacter sp. Cf136]CAE6098376.1 hypothetical protein AI2602V1_0700 [Citrobacter freundii]CAH3244885.1 hypothetical protein AI2602V1_0700 [Citrobacter freundii]CAH6136038.1 hypothetical protein AI3058V1_3444 [Citrobacter freundii]
MVDVLMLYIAKFGHVFAKLVDFAVKEPSALWGLLGSLVGGTITLLTTRLTLRHNLQVKTKELEHQDETKRNETLKNLRLNYVIEPALKWLTTHTQEMQTIYGLQFETAEVRNQYVARTDYWNEMSSIQARLASLGSDEVNQLFTEITRDRVNLNHIIFRITDGDPYKVLQSQINKTSDLIARLIREATS